MNKYWFKRFKKGFGFIPITWQGWLVFAFFIGIITSSNYAADFTQQIIILGIVVIIAEVIFRYKRAPKDQTEIVQSEGKWKQTMGAIIGGILAIAITTFIGISLIDNQHSTIGYPVRLENEAVWFEFHAIKDDFVVLVPVYPTVQSHETTHPDTNEKVAATTYLLDGKDLGNYVLVVSGRSSNIDYSDPEQFLQNLANGFKTTLETQYGKANEINSTFTSFKKYPAVDFSFEGESSDYKVRGFYVLADARIYAFIYSNTKDKFSPIYFSKFTDSFREEEVEPLVR